MIFGVGGRVVLIFRIVRGRGGDIRFLGIEGRVFFWEVFLIFGRGD